MQKTWKKALALALALCAVLGMCVPLSGTVNAADYTFQAPYTQELVDVLHGEMTMNNFFELVKYNGNDYIVVPADGGMLFIFDLTAYINRTPNASGNYIHDAVETGIGAPRGITHIGSRVYSVGDAEHVAWYDFSDGKSGKITLLGSGKGIVADEDGNLYVSGNGKVYRIEKDTYNVSTFYTSNRLTDILAITYYDGKLYIQGTVKKIYGGGSAIHEIITQGSDSGKANRTLYLQDIGSTYYMSCVNGMLFLGNVGSLVAVDTTEDGLTRYYGKLNRDNSVSLVTALAETDTAAPYILGTLPIASDGTGYAVLYDLGLYSYDAAYKSFAVKTSGGADTRNLRCKRTYIYNGSEYILTASPTSMNAWTLSGKSFPVSLGGASGIFKGGYTISSLRTMGPGVEGDDTVMYAGGYMASQVAGYDPYTAGLEHSVFSNGHSQTDAILPYDGKLYAGCYNGAYLVEYDPTTGETRDLIDGGIGSSVTPKQIRIHALAAGDGVIFFSTVPDSQDVGGYIGCYDIDKGTYTLLAHSEGGFNEQIAVTLAYDENNNILYAGSSVRGGDDATPTQSEAVLLAFGYDESTNNLTKLASTTVGGLTPGNDKPTYIAGITQDPDSGIFWGLVSQTLFTFKYENGALTTTHKWSATTYPADRYTQSGSRNWFPRQILFDDDHLYVVLDQETYGLSQFALSSDRSSVSNQKRIASTTNRIYTMGTDKNIYYANGKNITRLVISRATMVEELIDSYCAGETKKEKVLAAYDALTDSEKSRLSRRHAAVVFGLQGEECYYINESSAMVPSNLADAMANAGSGNTVYLLNDYEDDIVVENGVTLDLYGKTVNGTVTVGHLGGAVTDSTEAQGKITETLELDYATSLPKMPLCVVDDTEYVYRFYDYEANLYEAVKDSDNPGQINFWFDLEVIGEDAQKLIMGGQQTHIDIEATLTVDTVDGEAIKTFTVVWDDGDIQQCAIDQYMDAQGRNYGLYLGVTGITDEITYLHVEPSIKVFGCTVPFTGSDGKTTTIDKDVRVPRGVAIYGLWPTTLTK